MRTRSVALWTVLAALCIGIQLAPRPPNVESTSLIVFLVSALFGTLAGVLLGTSVMLINGFFSSWGFAGLMLPFQIAGMIIVGIAGGMYRRAKKGQYTGSSCSEAMVLGASLTLIYDIITNLGVAVSSTLVGMPLFPAFLGALIFGAPFSLIHVLSNSVVFLIAFFPLTKALKQFLGGENVWNEGFLSM
jgi:hypothetical protein